MNELDEPLRRLCEQFPDVPLDAVASVLGDSYQAVVEAAGEPLVDKAEELSRLRLEVRTRHPALTLTEVPLTASGPGMNADSWSRYPSTGR